MKVRQRFSKSASGMWVGKTDEGKPIVYGFAIVSKVRDESGSWVDYFDTQGDHIPDEVIERAAAKFMRLGGAGKVMHVGPTVAKCVFAMPFSTSIMSRLEPDAAEKMSRAGLVIGFECDEEIAAKARSGEYTGFSLGGWISASDEVKQRKAARAPKGKAHTGESNPKLRVVRELDLDEFSLVDRPAQEPALVACVKRRIVKAWVDDSTVPNMLTTEAEGHAHMLCCGSMHTSGETTNGEMLLEGGEVGYHSHPWTRDPATGTITIGASLGHTHEVETIAPVAVTVEVLLTPEVFADAVTASYSDDDEDAAGKRARANVDNSPGLGQNSRETMLTAEEKLAALTATHNAQSTELMTAKGRLSKVLTLSLASFAHSLTLPPEERVKFIDLDAPAQAAAIKAADEANPVVHTDKRGQVWRASDDPRAVANAKATDALEGELAVSKAEAVKVKLEKRAATELGNVPGKLTTKVAVLAAIEGIADEATRTEALKMLKSLDALSEDGLERVSVEGEAPEGEDDDEEDAGGDPTAIFEKGRAEFAKALNIDPIMATARYMQTEKGRAENEAVRDQLSQNRRPPPRAH